MLIGWNNRADSAAITASSEIVTLPGSNVQHPHVARKWQTAIGVKAASLIFDMGASVSCSLFAALGVNLGATGQTRIRASNSDPAVVASLLYDSGLFVSGATPEFGAIYKGFNAVTARYWRVDFDDVTVADNLKIGRVFVGPSWSPSMGQEYGWNVSVVDPSINEESYGGQDFSDIRPKRRVLDFSLNWMDRDEMYGNAFALAWKAGLTRDVLAVNDTLAGGFIAEQSVFGKLVSLTPLVHEKSRIYRTKFTIKERL